MIHKSSLHPLFTRSEPCRLKKSTMHLLIDCFIDFMISSCPAAQSPLNYPIFVESISVVGSSEPITKNHF